jgi:Sigma-70, region 4
MMFLTLDQFARWLILEVEPGRPDLLDFLQSRIGWPRQEVTLEQAGTAVGLTRERVRQIEARAISKLQNHNGFFDQGLLDRAVDEVMDVETYDDVAQVLRRAGLLESDYWTTKDFDSLVSTVGNPSVKLRWSELKQSFMNYDATITKAEGLIKELRDLNGFILRATLSLADPSIDLNDQRLIDGLRQRLFGLAITDHLIMAPKTERARIRRVLAEQLLLAPGNKLYSREAFDGVDRDLRGRGKRARGEASDVMKCVAVIFKEFSYLEVSDEIQLHSISPEEPDSDVIWRRMVSYLQTTPHKAAHIYDLLSFCIDECIKVTTAQHDALYGPGLRSDEHIFYIVGHEPSAIIKSELAASAELRYRRIGDYISYDSITRSGSLQINPVWIRSGMWYISVEFSAAIGGKPTLRCGMCGAGVSYPMVRETRNDVVRVPSDFVNHLVENHRVGAMRNVQFRIAGDTILFF